MQLRFLIAAINATEKNHRSKTPLKSPTELERTSTCQRFAVAAEPCGNVTAIGNQRLDVIQHHVLGR